MLIFKVVLISQCLLQLLVCQQTDLVYQSQSVGGTSDVVLLGGLFAVHSNFDGSVCTGLTEPSVQRVESMAYAINEINSRTDLLPNITLAFRIRDTCGSSRYGLDEAFHFVQATTREEACSTNRTTVSMSGMVGAQFSRVSINVANLLRLHRIPQISYISTADVLGDRSRFEYFFRTIPPDSLQARAIADIILKFDWTFVYALYSNDAYGRDGIAAVETFLSMNNRTCIAVKIALPITDLPESAYDNAIKQMSQNFIKHASVAIVFGQLKTAVGIMRAARKARENGTTGLDNMTWIGTDTWGDTLPEEYRRDAGGILSVLPRASQDKSFDDHYISLTPRNTSNPWFHELWEQTFNCSLAPNSSCISDNMLDRTAHVQASQLTLVTDAVYAFAHAIHILVGNYCINGILCNEILEDRLLGRAINGELLRESFYSVNFTGPSRNKITFNRTQETGAFFIKNLQYNDTTNNYSFEIVGSWDNGLEITEPIQWVTGDEVPRSICSEPCDIGYEQISRAESRCCWICSLCSSREISDGETCQSCQARDMPNSNKSACIPIPITHLEISHSWPIALLIFSSIGLLMTVCVIILFLVCYKNKIVKASSREISSILLAGLILCYIMPFMFVIKPSAASCAIRRFGVGFSFAMCFSALLVKTNRIYRIFSQASKASTKPPRFISPLSQVILAFMLIFVQVVIATIWLAVVPPSTSVIYRATSAELICSEKPVNYLIVSLIYNFILLMLSTVYAFLSRKVPANFNEAKYINITLYTLIIIWLAFIPIYATTLQFGAIYQTTSFIIAIILSAFTTLVCIFVPKLYLMASQLRKKDTTTHANGSSHNATSSLNASVSLNASGSYSVSTSYNAKRKDSALKK